MRSVVVNRPKNASLVAQLAALYNTLTESKPSEQLSFDLSDLRWTCPLLILPISAYIKTTNSEVRVDSSIIKPYLDTIHFPNGIDSVTGFQSLWHAGSDKTYVPLSVLRREIGEGRERLESMFITMLLKFIQPAPEGISSAVHYPIGELVTNIFEHSKQDVGFIFGQYYPTKQYLDICIVDRGRGLKASYKDGKNLDLTDEQAIVEVMKGHSVKPSQERGYGVWTSKKVVCEGLGGNFIMISGSAALISSKGSDQLVSLPGFNWQGVIVAYRMPKPSEPFDLSPYIE